MSKEIIYEKLSRLIKQAQKKETNAESDGTSDAAFWNGYWSGLVKAKQIIQKHEREGTTNE